MPRKHKAFAIVQKEIDKKIAQHKISRRTSPTASHRGKLALAIVRLKVMKRVLATAWNTKTCPPRM